MTEPSPPDLTTRRARLQHEIVEHLQAVEQYLEEEPALGITEELRRRGDILLADVAYFDWLAHLENTAAAELGAPASSGTPDPPTPVRDS